jgi:hypothetical protein
MWSSILTWWTLHATHSLLSWLGFCLWLLAAGKLAGVVTKNALTSTASRLTTLRKALGSSLFTREAQGLSCKGLGELPDDLMEQLGHPILTHRSAQPRHGVQS